MAFSTLADVPSEVDRAGYGAIGTKSAVMMPLSVEGRVVGATASTRCGPSGRGTRRSTHRLAVIASVFGEVLARQQRDEALRAACRKCSG